VTFTGVVGGADPQTQAIGDTTITAANVTTIDNFAAMSLTVNATATTLLGGDTSALNDIRINSATITANGNVYSDQGDIALAATGVLTLATGTTVQTEDGSVVLTGTTGISLGANVFTGGATGTVAITGDVTLTTNVRVDTSAVTAAGGGDITVTGDVDGAFALNLDAEGDMTITGNVGLTNLTSNSTGDTAVTGTIDSDGDIDLFAQGDVTLGGDLTAGGDILVTTGAVGTIAFESNVSTVTAGGDIVLSNTAVSATNVPAIATITSESTTGITFAASGDFTMTAGEKLTTFGDLTITTGANGTASLGDLVTIGDIRVTADTINFISRNAGDVLNADGTTTEDQGIDVVASGEFFFSVTPGLTGGLRPVHFASNTVEADALGTLNAWIVRWTDSSITLNSIVNGTTILDLAADGIDSLNNFEVAELAGAIRSMSTMTPIVMPGHDTFKDDDNDDDDEETTQEASIR